MVAGQGSDSREMRSQEEENEFLNTLTVLASPQPEGNGRGGNAVGWERLEGGKPIGLGKTTSMGFLGGITSAHWLLKFF